MSISKDQRILVTGGTGILGVDIVNSLLGNGYSNIEIFTRSGKDEGLSFAKNPFVTFTKGDVSALFPLSDSIDRADVIIHAAAIVSFDPRDFKKMHDVNVEGTANVVNLAADAQGKKLIHVSSIAAIGRSPHERLLDENTFWVNSKFNSYYGITKYLAEQEVWRAHFEGLDATIVNPSIILGDGRWDQSSSQIFKRVYEGLPFYPGGGTGIVDVKDVSRFIIKLMESEVSGERFILSAANISYRDLFTKLANAMRKKPPSRQAPKWMLSVLWRLEALRCFITQKSPLITRESVKTTQHHSKYDNSKSLGFSDFSYRDIEETLQEYGEKYAAYRN